MGFASDLRILYHLALKPVRGKDHAARMESFYAGQAGAYDDFRKRLLKGRQELWNLIPPPPGGTWVDMGGGTGANLEYFTQARSASEGSDASAQARSASEGSDASTLARSASEGPGRRLA